MKTSAFCTLKFRVILIEHKLSLNMDVFGKERNLIR